MGKASRCRGGSVAADLCVVIRLPLQDERPMG